MNRRSFLQLLAAVAAAPVLPMPRAHAPVLAEPAAAVGLEQITFKGCPVVWDEYVPDHSYDAVRYLLEQKVRRAEDGLRQYFDQRLFVGGSGVATPSEIVVPGASSPAVSRRS